MANVHLVNRKDANAYCDRSRRGYGRQVSLGHPPAATRMGRYPHRPQEPGRETSYGNAGVIQSEAVRPYAMPRDPKMLVDIALGRTNDVHYRLSSLPAHVGPLLKYWWHSAPSRYRSISVAYSRLVASALADHGALIHEVQADHLIDAGATPSYRDPVALDRAVEGAKSDSLEFGVRFRVLTGIELAQAESINCGHCPGAIHWLDPWTVSDPGVLVSAYAQLFQSLGGRILLGDADTLQEGSTGWSVGTTEGRVDAACVVVALGPWSPDLLRKFGKKVELVRKRGYHMHYRGTGMLELPLIDAAFGYVIAPMVKGLRIATGAELTSTNAPIKSNPLVPRKPSQENCWISERGLKLIHGSVQGHAARICCRSSGAHRGIAAFG